VDELGAAEVQRVGRFGAAQAGAARADELVHGAFGGHPRMTRRADAQVIFHGASIVGRQLAVDERRHEAVE
jgi:hypothetical protein